jgi:hypothetical protein
MRGEAFAPVPNRSMITGSCSAAYTLRSYVVTS